MDEESIRKLIGKTQLRIRLANPPMARSLAAAARQISDALPHVRVNEYTAPMLFDAVYKAIRQVGDGFWWLLGYEPRTHEVSIGLLAEKDPSIGLKLERLKQLRNDAAYRGVKISPENAMEIVKVWKEHCVRLLARLEKEAE